MFRKFSAVFIVAVMLLQLLPAFGSQANAAGNTFLFPNESANVLQPRITTDERVTLQGTLNNVNPSTISYSVFQIVDSKGTVSADDDLIGSSRLDQTSSVFVDGFNVTIFNLQLFPGLNRVTFKGLQGGGEVSESVYIEYRNGPVFYNLTAQIDGSSFPIQENSTTVVQSQASRGKSSYDISITGNAPNAQSVTIIVNGSSKTYNVNTSNNSSFAASPINLKKGKNLVTIKILNNNQIIETTREIAFYNGSVTFYDVNMNEGGTTPPKALEYRPNYSYTNKSNVQITGTVIVPNAYYDGPDSDTIKEPHPDPTVPMPIVYQISGGASLTGTVNATAVTPNNVTDSFYSYKFTITNADLDFASLLDDKNFNLTLSADNEVNRQLNITPVQEGTSDLGFSFRNGTKAYIYDINYLPGYTDPGYENLTGVDMEGANIFSLPFGVEVLIGNPAALGSGGLDYTANPIKVTDISGAGGPYTPVTGDYSTKPLSVTTVTKTVNGVAQTFGRVILEFPKMPNTGTQTISFQLSNTTQGSSEIKPVSVNLLYGPFANFVSAYDGMVINLDTTIPKDEPDGGSPATNLDQKALIIYQKLNAMAGELLNIANPSDIVYTSGAGQTVFMYINNTLIPLEQDTTRTPSTPSKFKIPDASTAAALNALFIGENKVKLVFQTSRNYYEKVLKINIVPTNLPVIPAPDTSGVFPYSTQYGSNPLANDPNFTLKGSIFSTTQSEMNVFGTFDFVDLGTLDLATVNAKLTGITNQTEYMLKITTPDRTTPYEWDLSQPFQVMKAGVVIGTAGTGTINGNLVVRYDLDTQTFSFILQNQKLHADGTPSIYNMFVYNSGIAGPRASYRVEVDPTSIPYKVLRPILPAKSIVNQDFIEVIIDAPGAQTVTIKGGSSKNVIAEKISFDSDNDGTVDYPGAYRAFIRGLKPGKANKIDFVITSGSDTSKDTIEIQYVPTNIPGAGILKPFASGNKVFEGDLNLTFAKGTSLIRKDFNVPQNLKNQVFNGHDLFFAIANPEDGVVDRREYETLPANFDAILQSFGTRFKVSYPTHFIKSSPVFWIDAGLADDPSSPAYDPLKMGVDPYQFPGAVGPGGATIPTYDDRPDNRELVTSKVGTLELKYDPSMRDVVGTIVTVFRYDVKGKYWENIGGVVDTKKHTVKVPFSQFGYYVVGKMVYAFNDVTQHPYAKDFLEAVYAKGIMNPVDLDRFGADIFTSRGEFARMMVKAVNLPLNYELSKSHFDDVPYTINPDALWDYRYVETAARAGLIRGTTPRSFEPNGNLSREQAAVIITRSLNLKLDTDRKKIDAGLQKLYKDYASIDYYARASVLAIAKKGFITGTPVDSADPKKGMVFEPKSNLIRSDAAILVARILADQKRLPKIG